MLLNVKVVQILIELWILNVIALLENMIEKHKLAILVLMGVLNVVGMDPPLCVLNVRVLIFYKELIV